MPLGPWTMIGDSTADPLIPRSQDSVPRPFRLEIFKSLNLYEVTIEELQAFFSDGRLTSHEYVEFCLERIRTVCDLFVDKQTTIEKVRGNC